MKKHLFSVLLLLPVFYLSAQVSVNQDNSAPDPSAMLDVKSTDKGMLIPRMTSAQRDAISNPAPGLIIYNTQDSCFNYYTGEAWVKDCGRSLEADQENFQALHAGGTAFDFGRGVSADAAGNSYITGIFQGTATFGNTTLTSAGGNAIFIAKYDPDGQVIWANQAGGDGEAISVDAAGNSYITGYFSGTTTFGNTTLTSAGNYDVCIAKYDPDGQVIWAIKAGGNFNDFGADIIVDAAGNSYITGTFQGTATFGNTTLSSSGQADIFIAKYDPAGQLIWAVKAGGTSLDISNGINIDAAGNSYVTGAFQGTTTFGNTNLVSSGNRDVFVAKYNPSGQVLWAVKAGGVDADQGGGISVEAAGNIFVTGGFEGTATFGDTTLTSGNGEFFVAKYDPAGQILWAQKAGGGGSGGADISADAAGNCFVTGAIQGTATFGNITLNAAGIYDVYVAKYDPNGQALWAVKAGGSDSDLGLCIDVDAAGNSFVTGGFEGTATFGNTTLTSNGNKDVFLWKLNPSDGGTTVLNNTNLSASQDLDPDPTNELQTLNLSGSTLSISNGNNVDIGIDDADADPTNELQTLNLSGSTLSISNGNSVDINDNDWTLSGNNMYNANNGNVGIGTATPAEKLDVQGNIRLANYINVNNAAGSVYIGRWLGPLQEDFSQVDRYNVGIGKYALNSITTGVSNTGVGGGALFSNATGNNNTALGYNANVSAGNLENATAIGANAYVTQSNSLILGSIAGVNFATNNTKVGIGTTAPKQALHVNGDYYGKGHVWLHAFEGDGNSGTAYLQARDDSGTSSIGLTLRTQNSGSIVNALHIGTSGNVAVGTPAAPGDTRFIVRGASGLNWDFLVNGSDGTTRFGVRNDGDIYANVLANTFAFPTNVVRDNNSNLRYAVSSRRFKTNIKPAGLSRDVDKFLSLELKAFQFKEDPRGLFDYGFIAEEVDSLGLSLPLSWKKDGRVESLYFDHIAFFNFAALQQHRDRIRALEDQLAQKDERLESQEKRIAELETQNAAFEQRFQQLEAALQQLNNAAGKSPLPNEK